MKKITQITGLCGLVIAALGIFARMIQGQGSLLVTLHLVLGGLLLLIGILTNLAEIREFLAKRGARYGTGAAIQMILWIVVLGMINYLAVTHDWVQDLTKNRLYTLSGQTLQVLNNLPGPVEATAFFQSDTLADVRRRLNLYTAAAPRFHLEFVDPDKHPELAEKKAISAYGTLLFEYGGKSIRITQHEEMDITNALIKATRSEEKVIYFLSGHEEADPGNDDKAGLSILRGALANQNYQVRGIFLTGTAVPEDASMVIIAGPRIPLAEVEIQALNNYLDRGGNLMVLLDPGYATNLEPLLAQYGISADDDVIIDPVHHLSSKDPFGLSPICSDFEQHPVTSNLPGKLLVFPRSRSLTLNKDPARKIRPMPLVRTSSDSYGETNRSLLRERGIARKDPEDLPGPLAVAGVASRKIDLPPWEQQKKQRSELQTRLLVVGNSRFLRNGELPTYSNFLFALNGINWLAGEEDLVFLPGFKRGGNRIYLSTPQKEGIFYATVLILPELLMILGVAIWWRRR